MYVEIAQGGHLEKCHAVLVGVYLGVPLPYFSVESQVQPVTHENLGEAGSMLVDLLQPPIQSVE